MSEDFDGGSGDAQSDIAATVTTRTGKISVLRMRKVLQPKIAAALHSLAERGPFTQEQSVDAMRVVLKGIDLNDYKSEFAQRIAAIETHVRHSQFGKAVRLLAQGQFDMFTEELAENVWLPAGQGMHVSLACATWAHILSKKTEQRRNAEDALAVCDTTDDVFDPHEKAMAADPRLEFREVMYRLGHWSRKEAVA